jgi:hypothetical protein
LFSLLDQLEKRFAVPGADEWECSAFHCRQIAADVFLLTYTLLQIESAERAAPRSGSALRKAGRLFITREPSLRTPSLAFPPTFFMTQSFDGGFR